MTVPTSRDRREPCATHTPRRSRRAGADTPSPQVYAMVLSSFLWFAIRSGCSLDRRGKYTLSRR